MNVHSFLFGLPGCEYIIARISLDRKPQREAGVGVFDKKRESRKKPAFTLLIFKAYLSDNTH